MLTRTRFHFLLAAPLEVHEMPWKCLDIQAQGFTNALQEHFHRPNFLWTPAASPQTHVIDRFVLLRVKNWNCLGVLEHCQLPVQIRALHNATGLPYGFVVSIFAGFFSISYGLCAEVPRSSSLILSLLADAGCSVGVTASCDEDVGEASDGELEDLVGRPGRTKVLIVPIIFAEFSEWQNCRCIFQKHHCHERIRVSDIFRCLFFSSLKKQKLHSFQLPMCGWCRPHPQWNWRKKGVRGGLWSQHAYGQQERP